MINEVREPHQQGNQKKPRHLRTFAVATITNSIHSVRLPGYVAHEQFLFGGAVKR